MEKTSSDEKIPNIYDADSPWQFFPLRSKNMLRLI